ncbi:WD40 repeat-like protein [Wolfiporia cocos MD-104 SS10]|uniref:WD40 repeat-like protein n=1 Tax=Wolfiporia cocos (strain MD-104) TaxID=742152 RepID=A0A2H3ITC9_WOLCO|nr:WD40 repeat-like protein [Wolfiporia cocos MD-104 SS10]
MSTPSKAKKAHTKPPRGRPAATSSISQPAVADHSSLTYLSTFSPRGDLFAFLSLAVDKHRLRVYDIVTRQSVAEHVVDNARVTSLCWARFDLSDSKNAGADDGDASHQPKRRRKKRHSMAAPAAKASPTSQLVVLGLSDGTVTLFSPSHGRIVRTLSNVASTTAITAVATAQDSNESPYVWTSSADGCIRLWDAAKNDFVSSWTSDDRLWYSSLAIRPSTSEDNRSDVLVAHHAIRLLSVATESAEAPLSERTKPQELAHFTGHASPVRSLQWSGSSRFLSIAEADRFVNVWDVPETRSEGRIVASIPLDSDARSFALSSSSSLLTLSASGKISVFPFPSDLSSLAPSNSKQKIPTLTPKSIISVSSKGTSPANVVAASFIQGEDGRIRVARLSNGVQPVFDVVAYLDDSGDYVHEVTITESAAALAKGAENVTGAPTKRYSESASLAVRSGAEQGQDASMDDLAMKDVDGDLDVDLAEMSLGQRLTALNGVERPGSSSDASDDDNAPASRTRVSSKQRAREGTIEAVPAGSLTRTLIQALHSSDARLLETCLAHSDPPLINNTVRRLPPQLAVPLITACVERLGRGARVGNMKGGGGGASSQRGTAMINWVRAVLAAHSGHLMTMPDLVARLSGLHATLTTRLALQDSLLALSGRLDMVISQIEMRSSAAPAPLPVPKDKSKQPQKREARRYVEGESEDEAEEGMEVEVESGDEEGSVEDVELGGDEEDEESDAAEETEEEDEDDDEDDEDGPKINGFIDDEAEEYSEDDEDEESE